MIQNGFVSFSLVNLEMGLNIKPQKKIFNMVLRFEIFLLLREGAQRYRNKASYIRTFVTLEAFEETKPRFETACMVYESTNDLAPD